VLVTVSQRLVQPGRGLEGDIEPPTRLDELRQPRQGGDRRAAAAHLRAEAELAELQDPESDVVAQRELDVHLGGGVEEHLGVEPGSLDRFDPRIRGGKLARVQHDGQPKLLVAELAELRGRADEPVHDPAVLGPADAAMLCQPLVERQLLGRKGRRMIDQPAEEGAPRICQRLGQPAVM